MNLATAIERALHREATAGPTTPGDRISWEIVQSIAPDGRAFILGAPLSASGTFVPTAGQRVAVLWKGGTPLMILAHRTRRAQFPPVRRVTAHGIIEELRVGNFDKKGADVWYRNYQKFERLNVQRLLAARLTPDVRWGFDGNSFAVQCEGGYYATFGLSRPDCNVIDADAPGEPALTWQGKPLESNAALTTVQFRYSHRKDIALWAPHLIRSDDWQFLGGIWQIVPTENAFEWDSPGSGSGMAAITSTVVFGLHDLLTGRIVDADGNGNVSATVEDWFLDADGHLKFLISVSWDSFLCRASGSASGSVHYPYGSGTNGMDGADEGISVGGTATGTIGGGQTELDHTPIDEQHVFLFDGVDGAAVWGTAPESVIFGSQERDWYSRIYEHQTGAHAGAGHGDPQIPYEAHYSGASGGSFNETKTLDVGTVGESRTVLDSSTGTFQLFDPGRCPAVAGPFFEESASPYGAVDMLDGGGDYLQGNAFTYTVNSGVLSGGIQLLWYYRVQRAELFQANNAPRLFLVLERYAFVAGTGYLNEIPQVGIFVADPAGAIIRALRPFQYGLNGGSLVAANAHRLIWILAAPWSVPTSTAYITELATGIEKAFTLEQFTAWSQTRKFLLSPDFAWDYADPKQFYLPEQLPALTMDEVLADLAGLAEQDLAAPGSIRAANDQTTLDPLGKYLPT